MKEVFSWGLIAILIGAVLVGLCLAALWAIRTWRNPKKPFKRLVQIEVDSLTLTRLWMTIVGHVLAGAMLIYNLFQPLEIITLAVTLLAHAVIVGGLTLSLLFAVPVIRRLWEEPLVKITLLAVPIPVAYLSKGYAQLWVSDLLGMAAANVPMTLLAATCFAACLGVGLLLTGTATAMQVLFMFSSFSESSVPKAPNGRPMLQLLLRTQPLSSNDQDLLRVRAFSKSLAMGLVVAFSLLSCVLASKAVFSLSTTPFGSAALSAIAFEFDAASAARCELKDRGESVAAEGDEPFLKAIPLASSQERAVLVWRQPALFRPLRLRDIGSEDQTMRRMAQLRIEKCYLTAAEKAEAAEKAVSK